jgi:hypothetical protein
MAEGPVAGSVPSGKVSLTLLLVNGQRKDGWIFNPSDTIDQVCQRTFDEWPTGTVDSAG